MDEGIPGGRAGASGARETSQRAKKRRRDTPPQEDTLGEISHLEGNLIPSSQPTPPPPLHLSPLWVPIQPDEGTAPPLLGPISLVPYPYPFTAGHQHLFPTPSVVWPPFPTTPANVTAQSGTPTYDEPTTRPTKGPATLPSVNYDLATISIEEHSKNAPLPVNAPSDSQKYTHPGGVRGKPRLEDLPDPPADQRPMQTIRALASAALRSEPKGKLALEEMVDRISIRFQYFQDFQNRNKLKKSIRHALSLYSEFKCSEDSESHTAKKVWRLTDEVLPNKYVRERKRKSRRAPAPDEIGQEVRPEREANVQDVAEESTCISESEDIEFIGIVRARDKVKRPAPERSHTAEGSQAGEKTSPAATDHPGTKPTLKRVLHGAAARSIIDQILTEKGSNDGDPIRSRSASPDESTSNIRLQAPRWGMSSSLQTAMPNALLQTPTTQSSPSFARSAFGVNSMSFPPPAGTKAFGAAVQPGPSNSVSAGFGFFATFGTIGGFTTARAPNPPNPADTGAGSDLGQPIADGDGS